MEKKEAGSKLDKRTLRHRVWCRMCGEHMKPEDELCPDCESYLGPTDAQWERLKPRDN